MDRYARALVVVHEVPRILPAEVVISNTSTDWAVDTHAKDNMLKEKMQCILGTLNDFERLNDKSKENECGVIY